MTKSEAKRPKRPKQLPLPGSVDESLARCVPQCLKIALAVSVTVYCQDCGDIHLLEGLNKVFGSEEDLYTHPANGWLDTAKSLCSYADDKLREGGTETETANGGDDCHPTDPRSDEDMQRMYEE